MFPLVSIPCFHDCNDLSSHRSHEEDEDMVRVTTQYLSKKGSLNAAKHGRDAKEHARKLTHLYLNDQYIDSIGDISSCKNLKVLFLQNNQLEKIENLDFASHLTHLYLQRNKLQKIQGFDGLVSLSKLYLGHNCISVVEGLKNLKCLKELHLEFQNLCPGEEIIFDPRTVASLGLTLEVLNLQGNNLTSLEDLVGLDCIKTLNVASNNLKDVTKIEAFLSAVPTLLELDMRNNPVVQDYKNCNKIIASTQNLRIFNERQISVTTLDFMKRFEEHQRTLVNQRPQAPNEFMNSISELAYNLPEALARDVTSSIFMDTSLVGGAQVNGDPGESTTSPQVCTPIDKGPYFHFPAFKSSTSLHYEGHTIPKPFHRHLMLGTQIGGMRHHLSKESKGKWPTFSLKQDKKVSKPNTDYRVVEENCQQRTKVKTGCGDMAWVEKFVPKEQQKKLIEEPCTRGHSTGLAYAANQINSQPMKEHSKGPLNVPQ